MFIPRHFQQHDEAALDALLAAYPFVSLVTQSDSGPFASHLPVLSKRDGEGLLVEGHWSRANPQWRHGSAALLVVQGPHAYISPAWYPDKETAARVPTWNYAVAHLRGCLDTFDDEASLADLVERLSERFETAVGSAWRFERGRPDHAAQLRGIVGFRLRPTQVEVKFKLNQNHPAANIEGAIAGLNASGGEQALAMAALMQSALSRANRG